LTQLANPFSACQSLSSHEPDRQRGLPLSSFLSFLITFPLRLNSDNFDNISFFGRLPIRFQLEELRRVVEQQTAALTQIRDSQAQVLKYVQFGDLVRQQTQLLISVQQNQANVLKAFQDYQNMVSLSAT